jgi:hypothetical protein
MNTCALITRSVERRTSVLPAADRAVCEASPVRRSSQRRSIEINFPLSGVTGLLFRRERM